jgi:hypothetical protein
MPGILKVFTEHDLTIKNLAILADKKDITKNVAIRRTSLFEKTLTIGNMYNRLVTYDSKIFHKPDNFFIGNAEFRTTLLFVISDYVCKNNHE